MEQARADGEQQKIQAFMEIVGQSADKALQFLQATNWQLEEAITLFYAEDDGSNAAPTQSASPTPVAWQEAMPSSSTSLPHAVVDPLNDSLGQNDEYVRPPLPVKREALYDDIVQYRAQRFAHNINQPSSIDAFRNFEEEAHYRNQGGSNNVVTSTDASKDSLAALYRPPFVLMYQGSFEQAKVAAGQHGKWLIINIQSTKEFSSYMLNRDTWAHEAVKDTIATTFVFWQVYDDTEEGRKVCTYYKLTGMPTTMVVDPITGQKMRSWEGMIDAERLLEDLVPYMDKGPMDRDNWNYPPQKRPRDSQFSMEKNIEGKPDFDEEEELRQALAVSLQEDTREASPKRNDKGDAVETEKSDEEAVNEPSAIPEADRVYLPLTEEPDQGSANVCRVAIRFPDGQRAQRRFCRSDPIQLLWSFCVSKVKEAEERHFSLMQTIPGMPGVALAYSSQATIEAAGVANSMLSMTWD